MPRIGANILTLVVLLCGSCGTVGVLDFPNCVTGTEGQCLLLDDLEDIAESAYLTDDEKREQFRELGIEDEKLIPSFDRPSRMTGSYTCSLITWGTATP